MILPPISTPNTPLLPSVCLRGGFEYVAGCTQGGLCGRNIGSAATMPGGIMNILAKTKEGIDNPSNLA